ncbi:MAG: ABC transporter permease [Pirellulaceae bacterium]
MNLAAKDIRHKPGRFALTAVGVGMLLMIVMGMGGIYRGIIDDAVQLIDNVDADLWLVQKDTRGPMAEVSRVPRNLVHRALAVPGVVRSREFVHHTIQREHRGKPLRIAVLGLSWPTDRGDWIPLIAGRALRQNHFEMVADKSLGLNLGEQLRFGRDEYSVVGITENMIGTGGDGVAFVTVADAQKIQFDVPGEAIRLEREARRERGLKSETGTLQPNLVDKAAGPANNLPPLSPPQISAVVINLDRSADIQTVAQTIAAWGDVSVYTQQEQRDLVLRGPVEKARRQIGLFRVLLTAIAAIIMALILYTLTLDKIQSIALLKLIGAPNHVILGMILQQAILLGVFGYGIAYVLGQYLFPLFPRRVIIRQEDLLQLAIAVAVISIVSSMLGIWKAMKVSPNEALD